MNKLILVLLALVLFSFGCKKNDATNPSGSNGDGYSDAQKAMLYDKIWYPTGPAGGVELQFLGGGVYRQALSLNGTYKWQNGGDTMNIVSYNNARFNYIFDNIGSSEFTFRTDFAGNNFETAYTYVDTK
jgi:hypothetical protein